MADKKISELVSITGSATAADDYFVVVDTSGAVTHKISREELNNAIEQDVLSTVDINGGTIDGTVIGATTAAAGTFTDLTVTGTVTGILTDVVDDTTPQLGGGLDLNGNDITGTGNIDNVGTITTDGLTVAGNVSVDGGTIKLDGNYPVGTANVALGNTALDSNVSGASNTAIGADALTANTASNNTAAGYQAGYTNTTGYENTLIGFQAGYLSTTARAITAVGYTAGYNVTTAQYGCFVGRGAGASVTTGTANNFFGVNASALGAGYYVTTGAKNTIIGGYNGNQGGLDIRTSSNNIVLSDGDGNPRLNFLSTQGFWSADATCSAGFGTGSNTFTVYCASGGFYQYIYPSFYLVTTAAGSTSDETLKTNMQNIPNALEKVCALNGFTYEFIEEGLCESTKGTQIGVGAQTVEAQFPNGVVTTQEDGIKSVRYERLVAPLIEAIKELSAKNDALEARIVALES